MADPVVSTRTTGLPVAWSARSSRSCVAGSPTSVRSPPANPGYETRISSPSTSPVRPPTNTTASEARAAASASSNGSFAPGRRQPPPGHQVRGRRPAVPAEIDRRVDPRQHRRSLQLAPPEILAAQPRGRVARARTEIGAVDGGNGPRVLPALDEVGTASVEHLRVRVNRVSYSREDRHRPGRRAVVVPEQGHHLVRVRPDDGDGLEA